MDTMARTVTSHVANNAKPRNATVKMVPVVLVFLATMASPVPRNAQDIALGSSVCNSPRLQYVPHPVRLVTMVRAVIIRAQKTAWKTDVSVVGTVCDVFPENREKLVNKVNENLRKL